LPTGAALRAQAEAAKNKIITLLAGGKIRPITKLGAHLLFDRARGSIAKNPRVVIPEIAAMMMGIAVFIAGAVSWIRLKDRSILVILATIIGFLATLLYALWILDIIRS
jgi:hypothetical protein